MIEEDKVQTRRSVVLSRGRGRDQAAHSQGKCQSQIYKVCWATAVEVPAGSAWFELEVLELRQAESDRKVADRLLGNTVGLRGRSVGQALLERRNGLLANVGDDAVETFLGWQLAVQSLATEGLVSVGEGLQSWVEALARLDGEGLSERTNAVEFGKDGLRGGLRLFGGGICLRTASTLDSVYLLLKVVDETLSEFNGTRHVGILRLEVLEVLLCGLDVRGDAGAVNTLGGRQNALVIGLVDCSSVGVNELKSLVGRVASGGVQIVVGGVEWVRNL